MKLSSKHLSISLRSVLLLLSLLVLTGTQFDFDSPARATDCCCSEMIQEQSSSCETDFRSTNPFTDHCDLTGCCNEQTPREIPTLSVKKISIRQNTPLVYPKVTRFDTNFLSRFYTENSANAPPYSPENFLPTFTTIQLRTIRLLC